MPILPGEDIPLDHGEQPPLHNWHRFSTLTEAQEWVDIQAQAWNAHLTDKERQAAVAYKGRQHRDINGWLRGTRTLSPGDETRIKKFIWHLDRAIAKATLGVDLVLYRGIEASADNYEVGGIYADDGYFSTTLNAALAHRYATGPNGEPGLVFEIHAPADTSAAFPDRLGVFEEQLEVLLGRATMVHVTAIQRPLTPSGHTIVVVDIVR